MRIPAPPSPADLDPLILEVPARSPLFRVHALDRDATAFNPGLGRPGRFHPFASADALDRPVPTLYAASTVRGALSETVFHDVPYRGPARRILVSRLDGLALSVIDVVVSVRVAALLGPGLRRIGVRRRDLIEVGPRSYPATAAWAAALHGSPARPAGLMWTSRQDDTSRAIVLFGDRVAPGTLVVASPALPLGAGAGLGVVEQAAIDAGIAVIR